MTNGAAGFPFFRSDSGAIRDTAAMTTILWRRTRSWLLALLALGGCASDMNQDMTHQHHTINYIELAATDLAEAKRFYGAAFGWKFNDYGPDYAGIQKDGGGEVGGMRKESSVQRGGPLVILYSDNIEASAEAVRSAGGQIVRATFTFPGGRRFHFTDPAGNELAVWSDK